MAGVTLLALLLIRRAFRCLARRRKDRVLLPSTPLQSARSSVLAGLIHRQMRRRCQRGLCQCATRTTRWLPVPVAREAERREGTRLLLPLCRFWLPCGP